MGRPGTRPARTSSPTNYMPVYHTEGSRMNYERRD